MTNHESLVEPAAPSALADSGESLLRNAHRECLTTLFSWLMMVAMLAPPVVLWKEMRMIARACAWCCVFFISVGALAQTSGNSKSAPQGPRHANFVYGTDSDRQKFDFWQAESDKPTPVLLMIHGGGWVRGDKSGYSRRAIRRYLDAGISVTVVNYRFIPQAMRQGVEPPVKACVMDAARALQTIRSKAQEWNVDPQRVGSTGGSAGACTSLWLALHDDLADPTSSDPIARESSRLTCAAVESAQTSLDPRELREWMPNAVYGGHAFGYWAEGRDRKGEFERLMANRDKVLPWIKEYSPIELVTRDDPPVYLNFANEKKTPIVGEPQPDPTHSAIYGMKLAEKMKAAGVEAVLSYPGHKDVKYGSIEAFLIEKLGAGQ